MTVHTGSIVALTFLFLCRAWALVSDGVIKIPDEGYRVNNMSRLTFFRTAQTWTTARHICRLKGGDLLSPSSQFMLDVIRAFATDPAVWKSVWDHTWTALYQQSNDVYAWSDRLCRRVVGAGYWKDAKQLDPSSKRCFQLNKDSFLWERDDCSTKKKFICDIKTGPCGLAYQSSPLRVVFGEEDTSETCLADCHTLQDCFLAAFSNASCAFLLAGGADSVLAEKQCFQGAVNESNTDSLQPADKDLTQPAICTLAPLLASSSSSSPPSSSLEPSSSSEWETSSTSLSPTPECPVLVSTVISTLISTVVSTALQTAYVTEATTLHSTAVLTSTVTSTVTSTLTSTVTSTMTSTVTSTAVVTSACQQTPHTVTLSPTHSCDVTTPVVPSPVVTSCQVTVSPECDVTPVTSSSSSAAVMSSPLHPTSALALPRVDGEVSLVCANVSNVGNISLELVLAALRAELSVDRRNTSQAVRRFVSVPDPRVSSKTIGFSAVLVCVLPLVLVFVVDVPVLARHLRAALCRLLPDRSHKAGVMTS